MPTTAPPDPAAALRRLARRLDRPVPTMWSPPPLPELIARIDAALAAPR